jgi:serine/threonine-protein kinase
MQLGDFVVEKAVAWGGMGIIYRAVHPLIGRKVAIKVLRPSFASDPEQVSRFLAEAKAVAAIKHRGIIDIIGFGKVPDGRQYMVMEFLDGESLEAVMLREGPMTPARALALIEQVLDALSAAHQAGVVHRDLKPANVYIAQQSDGSRYVKVVDFGLARQASVAELNRQSGKASIMAGTPEYFSPEQARGTAATPRTDLYCLGVMLFEMMTGQLPFAGDTLFDLLNGHLNIVPPRASTKVANLPPAVDDLIAQLLAKQPELRPSSAEVARQQVLRIIKKLKEEATAVGVSMPAERASVSSVVPTERLAPAGDTNRDLSVTPRIELNRPTAKQAPSPTAPGGGVWIGLGVLLACVVGGALIAFRPGDRPPKPVIVEPIPVREPVAVREVEPPPPYEPVPSAPPPEEAPAPVVVKKPPARLKLVAAKPAPECDEGADRQALLKKALGKYEQRYRQGPDRPKPERDAAESELSQLHQKIGAVKSRADCLELVRSLEAFNTRHGG